MKMHVEPEKDNLYDESWNWFGEIVLENDVERINKAVQAEEEDDKANIFFQNNNEKYLRAINKHFAKQRRGNFFHRTVPQACKTIILAIGLVTILVEIAMAYSTSARIFIVNLITEATPEYTTLRLERIEETVQVPSQWTGSYFPTKNPEGTMIRDVFDSPDDHCVSFCHPGEQEVIFSYEEVSNGALNIDTEDAEVSNVLIHGIAGKCTRKNNHITIFWKEGDVLSLVYLREDQISKALEYAEGVRRIEQ